MAYHPNTMPVFLWVQLTGEGLRDALPLALLLVALAGGAIAASTSFGCFPPELRLAS